MVEKQTRAESRNDQLKQQKRETFVVTPVFKMGDLVNNSDDEGRKKQRAPAKRNESYDHPDAHAFNQRGDGGYRRLLAEAVQSDVIFNQGKKNRQQQECKAKCHESKRPTFQNV